MTAISSLGNSHHVSPRDLLQQQLLQEVSSGAIASGDQDALSSALDDIDASLTSDRTSAGRSGKPPSPDEMKSKIEGLIADEVSSGKLTSDQAAELQNLFSDTFAKRGPGGSHGAGGPPPGPPPSEQDDSVSATDSTSSSGTSADDLMKMLQDFLKSVQDSRSKNAAYDANGDSSKTSTSFAALLVDYQT